MKEEELDVRWQGATEGRRAGHDMAVRN